MEPFKVTHRGRTFAAELRTDAPYALLRAAWLEPVLQLCWLDEPIEFDLQREQPGLMLEADSDRHLLELRHHAGLLLVRLSGGMETDEEYAAATSRWQLSLGQLRWCLRRFQDEFPWPVPRDVSASLLVNAPVATVFPYFAYPQWRGEWLAVPDLGTALVSTRREALHHWPAVNGTLAMQTVSQGTQTEVTLRARCWGEPADVEQLQESLRALLGWL